jgi:hypothetical protein
MSTHLSSALNPLHITALCAARSLLILAGIGRELIVLDPNITESASTNQNMDGFSPLISTGKVKFTHRITFVHYTHDTHPLAFVQCERSASIEVVDLNSLTISETLNHSEAITNFCVTIGSDPSVLQWNSSQANTHFNSKHQMKRSKILLAASDTSVSVKLWTIDKEPKFGTKLVSQLSKLQDPILQMYLDSVRVIIVDQAGCVSIWDPLTKQVWRKFNAMRSFPRDQIVGVYAAKPPNPKVIVGFASGTVVTLEARFSARKSQVKLGSVASNVSSLPRRAQNNAQNRMDNKFVITFFLIIYLY